MGCLEYPYLSFVQGREEEVDEKKEKRPFIFPAQTRLL